MKSLDDLLQSGPAMELWALSASNPQSVIATIMKMDHSLSKGTAAVRIKLLYLFEKYVDSIVDNEEEVLDEVIDTLGGLTGTICEIAKYELNCSQEKEGRQSYLSSKVMEESALKLQNYAPLAFRPCYVLRGNISGAARVLQKLENVARKNEKDEECLLPLSAKIKHHEYLSNRNVKELPFRKFSFTNGIDVKLIQKGTGLCYGTVVWDAGVELARFIVSNFDETVSRKNVLELGAGTGIVGIVSGLLKMEENLSQKKILMTDLEAVIPNLNDNVKLNKLSNDDGISTGTYVLGEPMPDLVSEFIGEKRGNEVVVVCGGMIYDGGFDLSGLLLKSLVDISLRIIKNGDGSDNTDDEIECHGSSPTIYISYSLRDVNTEAFFLERAKQFFKICTNKTTKIASGVGGGRIHILCLRLLKNVNVERNIDIKISAQQKWCKHCRQWTLTHDEANCLMNKRI